jgi:anti-repressor protein
MTNLNISIQSQIKSTVESELEFSVSFNDAWVWLDYSRKDAAKRVLEANFEKGLDYSSFHNIVEREVGATRVEEIYLTKDCFKQLAMLAATSKGKEVRLYFIQCEKEYKAIKANQPTDILYLLEQSAAAIKEARAQAAIAERKIVEMAPKVEMYDIICEAGKAVTINEFSSLLNIKNLGRNLMLNFLRTKGILQQNNLPYQQHMHHFNVVQKINTRRNNEVYLVTLVTPSGQQFLVKKLLEAGHNISSNVLNQVTKAAELDKAA